jgi:hypothetical protein
VVSQWRTHAQKAGLSSPSLARAGRAAAATRATTMRRRSGKAGGAGRDDGADADGQLRCHLLFITIAEPCVGGRESCAGPIAVVRAPSATGAPLRDWRKKDQYGAQNPDVRAHASRDEVGTAWARWRIDVMMTMRDDDDAIFTASTRG